MKKNSQLSAFTLIELLVAAALIAVAMTVVAGAFAAGYRVWQRASRLGGNCAAAVIALEQVHKDVANTVPCRRGLFRGGGDWIEIPSIVAVSEKTGIRDQPSSVRLEFNAAARRLDRVVHIFSFPEPDRDSRETLAEGVESIRYSYGDRGSRGKGSVSWMSSWEGQTNTPVAVMINMRVQQGGERFDFSRTIPIPCQ